MYNWRTSALPPPPVIFFNALMLTILPLDVLTIIFGWRNPSNDIRFLTGLLFGAGVCVFLFPSFVVLVPKNIKTLSALPSLQKSLLHYLVVASAGMIVKWDNPFSYSLLLALSIFVFLCLAAMIIVGLWKTTGKVFSSKFQFTFRKGG